MQPPALTTSHVDVFFGAFQALKEVSIDFEPGLIHALVGQNGAGKTTLARVIAGLVPATSGTVTVDGQVTPTGDVRATKALGIEMVHQSFALPPSMTVAEALEYGASDSRAVFGKRRLQAKWQHHLDDMGIQVDAGARMATLPVETQQSVEIARALSGNAKILILDEPTAVLSPEAITRLFDRIRALKARGVTVIVVLHKVREVLDVADTITVLRRGDVVMNMVPAEDVTLEAFSEAIIGPGKDTSTDVSAEKAVLLDETAPDSAGSTGSDTAVDALRRPQEQTPIAALRAVSTSPRGEGQGLSDVTTVLRSHEIVGIAGVEGNGQVALTRALAGLDDVTSGDIELQGQDVTRAPQARRRALGLRIIPFDRNTEGLSRSTSLWQNWAVPQLAGARRQRGLIRTAALRRQATDAFDSWGVAYSSIDQRASELSGGNAQKIILAREMDEDAKLIIAAQPTRGLDLGAVSFVWKSLRAARDGGASVLLISSDLDELTDVSDRILVVLGGRVVLDAAPPFDIDRIGRAMTGAQE